MNHDPVEIGKRLKAIFLDWKKDKPHGQRSARGFAESIGKSEVSVKNYFTGFYKSIPSDVLDKLSKMGYNSEWLLHGTGKKKADQKETLNFTSTLMLRTELANLRQEFKLLQIRTEAQIKELRNEIKELKK